MADRHDSYLATREDDANPSPETRQTLVVDPRDCHLSFLFPLLAQHGGMGF